MRVSDYLNVYKLDEHVKNGLVDIHFHKDLPLVLLRYSRTAEYDNLWDDVTEKCRGLIVNWNTGEIVARPFEKFFNFQTSFRPETYLENLPTTPPIVLDKLDGSLGILYVHEGVHYIASKGSFHSEHAEWATAWYRKNVINPQWPAGYTPIFEMLCESVQHHVVHYGYEGLILLALINNETGEEADYNTLYHWAHINGLGVPEIYGHNLLETILHNRPNAEGYVLSWSRPGCTPIKVKVKFADFLRLQRIVHDATPKHIFEALSEGDGGKLVDWIANTNPQLRQFIKDWMHKLNEEYARILKCSSTIMNEALHQCTSRKDFALYFNAPVNQTYAPVCFAMLDEKDYKRCIWKLVEPILRDSKPFAEVDEQELEYKR